MKAKGEGTVSTSAMPEVYLMVQGIVSGRTKAGIAGGVNIMLAWKTSARICLLQALSPVGRCKSFDATGDGYGRGEGFTLSLLRYTNLEHVWMLQIWHICHDQGHAQMEAFLHICLSARLTNSWWGKILTWASTLHHVIVRPQLVRTKGDVRQNGLLRLRFLNFYYHIYLSGLTYILRCIRINAIDICACKTSFQNLHPGALSSHLVIMSSFVCRYFLLTEAKKHRALNSQDIQRMMRKSCLKLSMMLEFSCLIAYVQDPNS